MICPTIYHLPDKLKVFPAWRSDGVHPWLRSQPNRFLLRTRKRCQNSPKTTLKTLLPGEIFSCPFLASGGYLRHVTA